jgi:transglutaminase-like putative cysteine protease
MLAPVTFDLSIRLCYEAEPGAALVMAMLPARTHRQQLAMERLRVRGASAQSAFTDAATATRYLHVAARGGVLELELDAQVRLLLAEHGARSLHRDAHAVPLGSPESLRFLAPSRFCPSDRLAALAEREFLGVDAPLARMQAIQTWVRRRLRVLPVEPASAGTRIGAAAAGPNAAETLERGAGTPQDLAHVTIALCRASRLPARLVTTIPDDGPATGDLHPWVEVLVEDAWLAVDPSRRLPRTALLRLGTGRDAADVPLALAHGDVVVREVRSRLSSPDTTMQALVERDVQAEAVSAATLGSLGEAVRWHQEARLAAGRRGTGDADASSRPAPSTVAAAAARASSTAPRRMAQVFAFPSFQAPRASSGDAR